MVARGWDVDSFNIVRMANVYDVSQPDLDYDAAWDLDDDGDVDVCDVVIAAYNYGDRW